MSQDKIGYALWMVRTAAKQSAIAGIAGGSMMVIGWIMLCHAALGVHKSEEKLPWSIAALALIAPSLSVVRYGEERGNWAVDGRAIFRWGRAQWQEKMVQPPKLEEMKAIAQLPAVPNEIPLLNLGQLRNASFVLIIGEQGSGKTTLAKMIGADRQGAGHSIQVVDPHGSATEWGDWEIIGAGRNFTAINKFMKAFDQGITQDYEAYSKGERSFPHRTVIGDELTQWGDRCASAPAFITSICSDIRKVNQHAILITHADTTDKLGGAKGLRDTIDQSAIKVVLEAELAGDGRYLPTGYGWLTFPRKQPILVRIPQQSTSISLPHEPETKLLPDAEINQSSGELAQPLQLIIEAAKANNGCVSVREAMRYKGLKNKYVAEEIKAFFYVLEGLSLGAVQREERYDRLVFWLYSDPDSNSLNS